MATFDPAPEKADRIVRSLIEDFYPDLVEAQVRIALVFARPTIREDGEQAGPAMVKDGRQVLGRLKKRSEEDRAAGLADVTLTIDAEEFERLELEDDADDAIRGFLGEWLEGIVVLRGDGHGGKPGPIKTNDRGQAMLKIRPFDFLVTGYRSAAERYGRHSLTRRQAREFHDTWGNLLFDFASDQATLPGIEPARPRRRGAAAVAASHR